MSMEAKEATALCLMGEAINLPKELIGELTPESGEVIWGYFDDKLPDEEIISPEEEEMPEEFNIILDSLIDRSGLRDDLRSKFGEAVLALRDNFKLEQARANLPDRPLREYRPREENIIDYIRSDEGFGPWVKAGALTRPLIREQRKAYDALSNWLRTNELPEDLPIPTKVEIVDRSLAILGSTSDAVRLGRAAASRLRRSP